MYVTLHKEVYGVNPPDDKEEFQDAAQDPQDGSSST